MENNPLRGFFGVSSPRSESKLVSPQPTPPTENIEYEIPSGMIEQLLANPYARDGTEHPDMHLIYVEQICGLFKLAGLPRDEVMKKVFPLSLKGKALAWYRLCDDIGACKCYIHAPIMSSQEKLLFEIFMLGFLVMINSCLILLVL